MSNSLRKTWKETASDPDPKSDLGYEHAPLATIHVNTDKEQFIFLPDEEDHLSESEFIIAGPDCVHLLSDRR